MGWQSFWDHFAMALESWLQRFVAALATPDAVADLFAEECGPIFEDFTAFLFALRRIS